MMLLLQYYGLSCMYVCMYDMVDPGVGCAPKMCEEEGGTGPDCVRTGCIVTTDGLVAVIGDCCV